MKYKRVDIELESRNLRANQTLNLMNDSKLSTVRIL